MTTENTLFYTEEEDTLWETVQKIHSGYKTPNHREEGPPAVSLAIEGLEIIGPISLENHFDER